MVGHILSYSVQSIRGLIQQKQQTMFKFNFHLKLTLQSQCSVGESITKSELRRSCSLDFLLMSYYNLIQSALQVSRRACVVNVGLLRSSGSDWWHRPPTPNSLQRRICSRSRQNCLAGQLAHITTSTSWKGKV